jgi:hypothetical protein
MKTGLYPIVIFAIVVMTIPSCTEEKKDEPKEEIVSQLIIGDPTSYGSDSMIVFPVGMTYVPVESVGSNADRENGYKDEMATEEVMNEANGTYSDQVNVRFSEGDMQMNSYGNFKMFANEEMGSVDMRNLIFYNQFTGESLRLYDEKLHIISFSVHYEFGDKPIIMYDIVKHDYNEDSLFDRKDPVMLYISDMNGDHFTQLTPEDETYLTYFYYYQSGRLLLKVSKDGDGNKQFDPYDQTIFREVNLKKPAMGEILFGEDLINDLKEQI